MYWSIDEILIHSWVTTRLYKSIDKILITVPSGLSKGWRSMSMQTGLGGRRGDLLLVWEDQLINAENVLLRVMRWNFTELYRFEFFRKKTHNMQFFTITAFYLGERMTLFKLFFAFALIPLLFADKTKCLNNVYKRALFKRIQYKIFVGWKQHIKLVSIMQQVLFCMWWCTGGKR